MKDSQTINIACACDQGFLPYTAAMLRSVLNHNQRHTLNIYLLYTNIPDKEIERLKKMIHRSNQNFFPCLANTQRISDLPISQHITIETYLRLLIPQLVHSEIEKILYLDGDLIVRKDLAEIWNTSLTDFPLAAIPNRKPVTPNNRLRLTPGNYYFNTGVMLLNLNWWRNNELTQRVLEFIAENPEKLKWWDQDALNAVVDGHFTQLSRQWNVVSEYFYDEDLKQKYLTLIQDPAIVHFSGMGNKPWEFSSTHPYKKEYVEYQNETPWKASIFNSRLNFLYIFAKKLKTYFH